MYQMYHWLHSVHTCTQLLMHEVRFCATLLSNTLILFYHNIITILVFVGHRLATKVFIG